MNENVFYPPNFKYLSDCIVGDIVTRITRSSVTENTSNHKTISGADRNQANLHAVNRGNNTCTKETTDPVERLREQRRRASVRHRKKVMLHEVKLRKDVWQLRELINKLEVQRREVLGSPMKYLYCNAHMDLTTLSWKQYTTNISRPALPKPTCWSVAVEYFRLFRNGFTGSIPKTTRMIDSQTQIDFLRAVMAPDVIYDTVAGVRGLVQNWQRVTATHPDIDISLVRLEQGPDDSVVATVKVLTTISEDTVRYAFPHLVDGNTFSLLAQKLLGCQLEIDGVLQMTWDANEGRVVNLQSRANMMMEMLRILGSLEEVASVFDSAYIDPEWRALAH